MKTLNEMLENQMQDEKFRKEYEEMQPEFDVIRAIVDARTSQNLTQKELSERTGINQADISKLENGTRNPSVSLLKRLAEGMGMVLKIEFIQNRKFDGFGQRKLPNKNASPERMRKVGRGSRSKRCLLYKGWDCPI